MKRKTIGKWIGLAGMLLLLAIAGYVGYVVQAYDRIADGQSLEIDNRSSDVMKTQKKYTVVTYNVGFGAFSPEYSFFMDGGEYARAFDEQAVMANTQGAIRVLQQLQPDLLLFQEVDLDSTRSYHINQMEMFIQAIPGYSSNFAINYDSPYYLYPLTQPHGKSLSGLATFARFTMGSAVRRSLPAEDGWRKYFDLDRCYSVTKIPVENGKTLCLYHVHLSAYAEESELIYQQLEVLFEDMQQEYQAGNYVIAGGDFNKDLLGDSSQYFLSQQDWGDNGMPGWAQPFPTDRIPEHFTLCREEPVQTPSCRDSSEPYTSGQTYVTVVDGFICSDNIQVEKTQVIDTQFSYSDHNPVELTFTLLDEEL